jgi:hypothetical protein
MTTHVIDLYELFSGLYQPNLDIGIDSIFDNYRANQTSQPDRVVLLWHHDFNTEFFYTVPYTLEKFTIKFASIGITDLIFTVSDLAKDFRSELSAYNVIYLSSVISMIDYYNPIIPTPNRIEYKNKFLFLPGKLDKFNRIGLLSELYKHNLIDDRYGEIKISTQQLSLDLALFVAADIDFNKFINHLTSFKSTEYLDKKFSYFDLAVDLHKKTKFSLIAETEFNTNNKQFISEKTFKAIVNKHPFVLAANVGVLSTLKKMGFRTFENYLPVSDYDSITDPNLRLTAIVKNVQGILDMSDDEFLPLKQDAEHNFNIFAELVLNNRAELAATINETNISTLLDNKSIIELLHSKALYYYNNLDKLQTLIEKNNQTHRIYDDMINWRIFYSSVKGENWPKFCEQDKINTLPEWIQKEIKEFQNS